MKCAGCLASADCGSTVRIQINFVGLGKKEECVTRKCVGVTESVRNCCEVTCMHHLCCYFLDNSKVTKL